MPRVLTELVPYTSGSCQFIDNHWEYFWHIWNFDPKWINKKLRHFPQPSWINISFLVIMNTVDSNKKASIFCIVINDFNTPVFHCVQMAYNLKTRNYYMYWLIMTRHCQSQSWVYLVVGFPNGIAMILLILKLEWDMKMDIFPLLLHLVV